MQNIEPKDHNVTYSIFDPTVDARFAIVADVAVNSELLTATEALELYSTLFRDAMQGIVTVANLKGSQRIEFNYGPARSAPVSPTAADVARLNRAIARNKRPPELPRFL